VLQNALIGVFVGDTIDSTHTPVSVGGDIENVQTIYPLLQQVFYVGNGMTPLGQTRVIVVPAGATRLFLASAAGGFNSSGSFIASVSSATIPPVTSSTNPITVASSADLYFADQPNGTGVVASNGFASALAPYSTPIRVPLSLTPGQTLHIRSSALGPGLGLSQVPFGLAADSPTADAFGLSGIRLQASGDLIGVFVGDKIDPTKTPPDLNYAFSSPPALQTPLLQQVFDAGGPIFVAPNVKVPSGATRLFLGLAGGRLGDISSVTTVIAPDNANAPQINAGGIVTNAGFTVGPVSPGSMVAIFGSNFGPVSGASSVPLPTTLGNTQVFFDAVPAPLFFVSPTQIVAQVPFETPFSILRSSSALVTVVTNGIIGIPQSVALAPFAGGIFTTASGDPVIVDYNTGSLVSPSAPASRGDTLIIWATGLGPTFLDPATGNAAPAAPSPTLLPIQVVLKSPVSGAQVILPVQYAGLAPGFIALDQINVQIPNDAPTGTVILQIQSPGFNSPPQYTIGIH
jgi:uncharacterized protein (TIGR03437 family)